MGIITVHITVNNIGTDTGPFDLYDNNLKLIATNITKADLASGVSIDVKDTTSQISIYSKGICNNSLSVPVTTFPLSATPSPTPTLSATNTPTPTATVSRTPTVTPSVTLSISITPSITPSVTPSISISNTPSVTPSISISQTPSVTPSISISATPSVTPSISISATPSLTPSISITPSVTPSTTPVANIMYWQYNNTTSDASMVIYKNYSVVVSTNTNGASGTFSHNPGDYIQIYSYTSIKVSDYTSACVAFNGTTILSDNQTDTDSYVAFNSAAGTYSLSGCQTTFSLGCTCLEA